MIELLYSLTVKEMNSRFQVLHNTRNKYVNETTKEGVGVLVV